MSPPPPFLPPGGGGREGSHHQLNGDLAEIINPSASQISGTYAYWVQDIEFGLTEDRKFSLFYMPIKFDLRAMSIFLSIKKWLQFTKWRWSNENGKGLSNSYAFRILAFP